MSSELQKAIIEHDKDMARLDRNTIRGHWHWYEADEGGVFVLDSVAQKLLTEDQCRECLHINNDQPLPFASYWEDTAK